MNVIETTNLTKMYKGKAAVDSVSMTVRKGEIFGFLGRNGAGKSTFINMLTGIIYPSTGTFSILNEEKSLDNAKSKMGVLPDYTNFYGTLTAFEHVQYFSEITGVKLSKAQINQLLETIGLGQHTRTKVKHFSFGMKKKLGIAQAIAHNPELIFLDEPTSGVDVESAIEIQRLIMDLNRQGKTIFMTSHNLHELEKVCHRVAIMKAGRITAIGSMADLKKQHQSTFQAVIKHTNKEVDQDLEQFITKIGEIRSWDQGLLTISLSSEADIPKITRALWQKNIEVFRIEWHQPSLEDIFLNQ